MPSASFHISGNSDSGRSWQKRGWCPEKNGSFSKGYKTLPKPTQPEQTAGPIPLGSSMTFGQIQSVGIGSEMKSISDWPKVTRTPSLLVIGPKTPSLLVIDPKSPSQSPGDWPKVSQPAFMPEMGLELPTKLPLVLLPSDPLDKALAGQDAFFLEQTKKQPVKVSAGPVPGLQAEPHLLRCFLLQRPDRLKKTPSELPAMEIISPGGSYNPSFQSHQVRATLGELPILSDPLGWISRRVPGGRLAEVCVKSSHWALLLQAFEAELVRQKAEERLQRQLNFPTAAEAPTQGLNSVLNSSWDRIIQRGDHNDWRKGFSTVGGVTIPMGTSGLACFGWAWQTQAHLNVGERKSSHVEEDNLQGLGVIFEGMSSKLQPQLNDVGPAFHTPIPPSSGWGSLADYKANSQSPSDWPKVTQSAFLVTQSAFLPKNSQSPGDWPKVTQPDFVTKAGLELPCGRNRRDASPSPLPLQVGLWGHDVPGSPTTGLPLGSRAGLQRLLKTLVGQMGHTVYCKSVGLNESQRLDSVGKGLPPRPLGLPFQLLSSLLPSYTGDSEGEEGQGSPPRPPEEDLQAASGEASCLLTATAVREKKTEQQRKKEKAAKQLVSSPSPGVGNLRATTVLTGSPPFNSGADRNLLLAYCPFSSADQKSGSPTIESPSAASFFILLTGDRVPPQRDERATCGSRATDCRPLAYPVETLGQGNLLCATSVSRRVKTKIPMVPSLPGLPSEGSSSAFASGSKVPPSLKPQCHRSGVAFWAAGQPALIEPLCRGCCGSQSACHLAQPGAAICCLCVSFAEGKGDASLWEPTESQPTAHRQGVGRRLPPPPLTHPPFPPLSLLPAQKARELSEKAARLRKQELFQLKSIRLQLKQREAELQRRKRRREAKRKLEAVKPKRLGRLKLKHRKDGCRNWSNPPTQAGNPTPFLTDGSLLDPFLLSVAAPQILKDCYPTSQAQFPQPSFVGCHKGKSMEVLCPPGHGCPKGAFFKKQLDFLFFFLEGVSLLLQEASSDEKRNFKGKRESPVGVGLDDFQGPFQFCSVFQLARSRRRAFSAIPPALLKTWPCHFTGEVIDHLTTDPTFLLPPPSCSCLPHLLIEPQLLVLSRYSTSNTSTEKLKDEGWQKEKLLSCLYHLFPGRYEEPDVDDAQGKRRSGLLAPLPGGEMSPGGVTTIFLSAAGHLPFLLCSAPATAQIMPASLQLGRPGLFGTAIPHPLNGDGRETHTHTQGARLQKAFIQLSLACWEEEVPTPVARLRDAGRNPEILQWPQGKKRDFTAVFHSYNLCEPPLWSRDQTSDDWQPVHTLQPQLAPLRENWWLTFLSGLVNWLLEQIIRAENRFVMTQRGVAQRQPSQIISRMSWLPSGLEKNS
ncbi:Glioma tumor suppressor candidate region gene 2 protein, partial [Ophiophagus hannah]